MVEALSSPSSSELHLEPTLDEGNKKWSNRTKHIKKAVNKREHRSTVITTNIMC